MSDSVKKYHEMQEAAKLQTQFHSDVKKAYKILIDYDIQDIEKALEIYNKTK